MSPDSLSRATFRETPLLRSDQPVREAVRALLDTELPALPVVAADGALVGIFGEREFIAALFPGYLGELRSAAFVSESIEDVIDKRMGCSLEPVSKYANREHIAAGRRHSDTELAETFLHHRVLIIPIVEDERVLGVVTRSDFFKALVERFIDRD